MAMRTTMLSASGLWTDPNPHAEVPEGALREAKDIVIRRAGVIEPRPTFTTAVSGWTPPAQQATRLVPIGTDTLVFDDGNGSARWLSDGDAVTGFGAVAGAGHRGYAKARESTYITDVNGVQKVTGPLATAAVDAGLPKAMQGTLAPVNADTDGFVALGDYVAYRVLYRREDSNGYVLRSAPSGRMVRVHDAVDATATMALTLPLPAGLVVGDVVEVYRSRSSDNADPSDELMLACERELTSFDLAADQVTVSDRTPEGSLGASLYANELQNGLVASKYRPPLALDVAPYRGSMFYANTTSGHVKALSISDISHDTGDGFALAGFTAAISATFAITSTSVTVSTTDGFAIGMLLIDDGDEPGDTGACISAGTYITAIGVGTVTISQPATANGTNDVLGVPWLDIDGERFFCWSASDPTPANADYYQVNRYAGSQRQLAESIAYVANTVFAGTGVVVSSAAASEDECKLLIEGDRAHVSTAIDMLGTPRNAFIPQLDRTTPITTDQDVTAHRLFWSDADEPEAVSPLSFVDIGDEGAAILRILAAGDALWVLKEDGVWRLTGSGADAGWRVDPVTPSVRPLSARLACVVDDTVMVWTDRGVVALSDGGIRALSAQAIGDTLRTQQEALHLLSPLAVTGAFLAAGDSNDELYLGVPAGSSDTYSDEVFVLNMKTGAWVRWDIDVIDLVEHPSTGKLVMAKRVPGNDYTVLVEGGTESFQPSISWVGQSLKDPGLMKRWSQVLVMFDTMRGIDRIDLSYTSDLSTTPSTVTTYDPASAVAVDRHTAVPTYVPRSHCMSTVLYPTVGIVQSTTPAWELVALSLDFEPTSMKPRRVTA